MSTTPVQAIPTGFHTLTPHLVCDGAADAIAFYQRAFGAEELSRMPGPGGKIMHAMIRIGDSLVMLNDAFPEMGAKGPLALGGTPVTLHLYSADADAAFARALEAGATVRMPLENQFWGDRYGIVTDPFGHHWSIATHVEDRTPEQMMAAMQAMSSPGCA